MGRDVPRAKSIPQWQWGEEMSEARIYGNLTVRQRTGFLFGLGPVASMMGLGLIAAVIAIAAVFQNIILAIVVLLVGSTTLFFTRSAPNDVSLLKKMKEIKKIQIEARVMGDLAMNHIIPVATHYQSQLAKNVQNMVNIFGDVEGKQLSERNIKIIREIAERTNIIETGVEELVNARKQANKIESQREKAIAYHDTIAPKMEAIRYQIDKLELVVSDELWTLPKYRELLFIR